MTFDERLAALIVRYHAHPHPQARRFVAHARHYLDCRYRSPLAVRWARAVRKRGME